MCGFYMIICRFCGVNSAVGSEGLDAFSCGGGLRLVRAGGAQGGQGIGSAAPIQVGGVTVALIACARAGVLAKTQKNRLTGQGCNSSGGIAVG